MGYTGSVDLVSGIRPKNNGTFPLVDAKDVRVDDNTRLDAALANASQTAAGTVRFDTAQTLTDEQKTVARTNVGAASQSDLEALKAVRYDTAQSLTDEQKQQARENIGAGEVDATLSVEGMAADAKKTGDEITALKGDLSDLSDSLTIEKEAEFISNSYINTGYGGIGYQIDPSPVSNAQLSCVNLPCKKDDKFTLTGSGGQTGRLWCFTDTEYKKLSISDVNATADNLELIAPADGYLIVNTYNNQEHSVKHYDIFGANDFKEDLDNLSTEIDEVKNFFIIEKEAEFVDGSMISTGYGGIGYQIDPSPVSNAQLSCVNLPCKKDDKFTLTGSGGQTGRLWCFTDTEYKKLSISDVNATADNLELIAPADGYLIVNTYNNQEHSVKYYAYGNTNTNSNIVITDPNLLQWRMGVFTATGPQHYAYGILPTDRMFTIAKVKAGSTIKKKAGFPKNIVLSYGYKTDADSTNISGYNNNVTNDIVVEQDCYIYLGVKYNPIENLINNDILDALVLNLIVDEYKSVFNKSEDYRWYGWPCPEIYYEGQHIDTTGWNNYITNINAIHQAFDNLCTQSGGYLTRTKDYGVAYTGNADNTDYSADSEWHMYEYTAKPITTDNKLLPKIAITCCMHGNEKMSAYAMHYLMYDLINNSSKNAVLSYLRSNCIISFVPICNPWGFIRSTPSRLNENGVNLNRNFPTKNWEEWEDTRTDGNGSEYGGMNYKGESAASELQTQLMMRFYRDNYDAVIIVDLHTNGANTSARDQVSSFMTTEPTDTSDVNYETLHSFLKPGHLFTGRITPWMNEQYSAGLPTNMAVGAVSVMPDYPCSSWWITENVGTVGLCYEVLAGSGTGYLGEKLTQYSADTIKAAAEELGNFLVTMMAHCKTLN